MLRPIGDRLIACSKINHRNTDDCGSDVILVRRSVLPLGAFSSQLRDSKIEFPIH
jgi:hypothetical protein